MHDEIEAAPFLGDGGEHRVDAAVVGDIAGQHDFEPTDCARVVRAFQRLALKGEKPVPAPCSAAALAIPQAIDRSFATPMIRPRLPAISPNFPSFHSPISAEY